ncbi:circadian clock protein KaiC [Legionella sp. D16C41]|uniref:circadian clock protein KaiC n=1 Tax=Legionella sp. D16C41 TaxID=3402688 RepID=UPI003AF8C782
MSIKKTSTGIIGLDKILQGGYIKGQSTLLKGSPGTGKTIFTLLFAYAQIKAGKNVIYITCDEKPEQILLHMDSFGLNGTQLQRKNKLIILDFTPTFDEIVGEFDLNIVLLRIARAKQKFNSDVLILDSLHSLFLGLTHEDNFSVEILRLFQWIKQERLTFLATIAGHAEICKTDFYEEYIVDCIIELKQAITNNLMTRYLRVVKLRSSAHGTNEYPFSIVQNGISLLPITETKLDTYTSRQYLSTGIKDLDKMFGNKGYQVGSSIMISGKSGTAKSIFAAHFAYAAASQGQKVLLVSFEESPKDIISHMRSLNLDLAPLIKDKKLTILARRSVEMGLEDHIITLIELVDHHQASVLILDPISALLDLGTRMNVKNLFIRFIAHMTSLNKTLLFTELLPDDMKGYSELGLSSLTTTWLRLSQVANNGEFNRLLYIAKSRGIKTSNQIKEFIIDDTGLTIEAPYIGDGEMIFGSQKSAWILKDKQQDICRRQAIKQLDDELKALDNELAAQRKINELNYLAKKNKLLRKQKRLVNEQEQVKTQREANKVLRD